MKRFIVWFVILLFIVQAAAAHTGQYHLFAGSGKGVLVFAIIFLFTSLYLGESIGDNLLGKSIMLSGISIATFFSLIYGNTLDIGWGYLAFPILAAFSFLYFYVDHKIFRRTIFVLFVLAFFIATAWEAFGHHDPELFAQELYREGNPIRDAPLLNKIVYYPWSFHDKIHWIVVVLMLYTCYHFRFFSSRKLTRHPPSCTAANDPGYAGEHSIHKLHRHFWRANVFLIAIHWTEVIRGLTFGLEYTYTFSQQLLGIIAEFSYVFFFTLWLGTCFFFKYLLAYGHSCYACKSGVRVQLEHTENRANLLHGLFLWLTVASAVLLLILEGHL